MKKALSPLQRTLNLWAIVLIIWSVYRTKIFLPEWFDEFVAKPLVFILPVLIYIRKYEFTPILSSIGLSKVNMFKNIKTSLFIGGLLTLSAIFANFFRNGTFDFSSGIMAMGTSKLIFVVAIALATAFSEELLSRGFVLRRLYQDSKNIFSASFLSSILFLVLHIPILLTNNELQGNMILFFFVTDFILSMVNSFLFIESDNLVAPILVHAFYNLAIVLYI